MLKKKVNSKSLYNIKRIKKYLINRICQKMYIKSMIITLKKAK